MPIRPIATGTRSGRAPTIAPWCRARIGRIATRRAWAIFATTVRVTSTVRRCPLRQSWIRNRRRAASSVVKRPAARHRWSRKLLLSDGIPNPRHADAHLLVRQVHRALLAPERAQPAGLPRGGSGPRPNLYFYLQHVVDRLRPQRNQGLDHRHLRVQPQQLRTKRKLAKIRIFTHESPRIE